MSAARFDLLLFSTDPAMIARSVAGGVRGVVIDWESIGKEERQAAADTQINRDTVDDLRRVRRSTAAPIICRLNPVGPTTAEEVDQAIDGGADELLLPMVRAAGEVEAALELVGGRRGVGILVETAAAVGAIDALVRLPLARVYVGLNDLAIERRTSNIFASVADGTVERVRRRVPDSVPFGFAGLTLPERGSPIPCRLLIAEMARLRAGFTFLRRSFHRDVRGRDPAAEVTRILAALESAGGRPPERVERERCELEEAVRAWPLDVAAAGVRAGDR